MCVCVCVCVCVLLHSDTYIEEMNSNTPLKTLVQDLISLWEELIFKNLISNNCQK
jgi:hypothetical protein